MAEIRKFDPAAGNAIAQALRQAMGEPVRPNPPGRSAGSGAAAPAPDPEGERTAWMNLKLTEPDQKTSDPTA